jgi:hypothetical protein
MADDRPRWREDFPVRWDEDNYMTRRELAKFLTLGSGLLAGVNVLIAFIGLLLVVIQLWLVAAALDALSARQFAVLVPTAVASGVLFVLSAGLLWYVVSFDGRLGQWGRRG